MTKELERPSRFNWSRVRWLAYLIILLGIAGWRYIPRPWKPTRVVETQHYIISSTASQEQTEEIGRVVELLYNAYSNRLGTLRGFRSNHPKLKLLLYKNREEMRWINPNLGWAEAYYRPPYCRAYYSASEANPYHWMLHEAVHQLNHEVAQLHLAKWLEEGVAEYFSTSRIEGGQLVPGQIDEDTYPVWWIDDIATAPELRACITNGSVISLRSIISNSGGPSMNKEFNLYYLHWWTLTHFIFESPKYRVAATALMERGGDLKSFEKVIGPVETVEPEWFGHVRMMKDGLNTGVTNFSKPHAN